MILDHVSIVEGQAQYNQWQSQAGYLQGTKNFRLY